MKRKSIPTELECRATAELRSDVAEDLSHPDKPIATILSRKEKDTDEAEDEPDHGD